MAIKPCSVAALTTQGTAAIAARWPAVAARSFSERRTVVESWFRCCTRPLLEHAATVEACSHEPAATPRCGRVGCLCSSARASALCVRRIHNHPRGNRTPISGWPRRCVSGPTASARQHCVGSWPQLTAFVIAATAAASRFGREPGDRLHQRSARDSCRRGRASWLLAAASTEITASTEPSGVSLNNKRNE